MRANLVSLQATAEQMATTQSRLATGKKVNSALDNPASFFAAQGYTQRAGLLNGLKDSIGDAVQMIKAANNGVTAVTSLIENLRGQLSQARAAIGEGSTSGATLSGIATQYNEIIKQINGVTLSDASYKGINFLKGDSITVNFNEQASTTLQLSGFNAAAAEASGSGGLGISGGSTGTVTSTSTGSLASTDIDTTSGIANVETTLNTALATLRTESAKLANNLSILTVRQQFLTNMVNTLTDGANNLVAADQNEEGANMLMLQTRTSLGTTSLSLASQAAQSILRLF